MVDLLGGLVVAVEEIPADSLLAKLAFPLGIIVFLGTTYLLLRSNLGTRRAYLVLGTSFFGFMIIISLFWTFGAPGTPQAVGPSHLPGPPRDAYEPTWVPFAQDSLVAERPEYQFVQDYPDGFGEVPEDASIDPKAGQGAIVDFFTAEDAEFDREPADGFSADWVVDQTRYAEADNGFPVIAVTFVEANEDGEVAEDGGEVTLFAFFDAGAPLFPSLVVVGLSVLGFAIHAPLLAADENRQRREEAELAEPEEEKVPAGA